HAGEGETAPFWGSIQESLGENTPAGFFRGLHLQPKIPDRSIAPPEANATCDGDIFYYVTIYVYKFLAQLHSLSDVSEAIIISMSSTATKLLSTYYLCEGCLDFNADEIAIACIQFTFLYCGIVASSVKYLMKKELASVDNKDRISDILDELIIVSDVSTALKYI
ncbi:hypothetical protein AVEN_149653-1, partial [Araneus ventricosus]